MGLIIWTPDRLPWCLASDVVGTVSALGEGVTSYAIGDRVMGYTNQDAPGSCQSGMQQYALADVDGALCKIPEPLSYDEAATLPTNLGTVFVALFLNLGIKRPWSEEGDVPEILVIIGGGSNCGE